MDETTTNFWNKTAAELTVKDNLIVAAAIPACMVGGVVIVGLAFGAYNKVSDKFQKRREARQNETTEES